MRRLLMLSLAGLVTSGCQCGSEGSGLAITVELQGSSAQCVIAGVQVEGSTGFHATPEAIAVAQRPKSIFGVARTISDAGVLLSGMISRSALCP